MQGRTVNPRFGPRPAFWALAAVLAAGPASAQTPSAVRSHLMGDRVVMLAPGERVILRLAPDGRLQMVSTAPAQPADAAPPRPATRAEAGRNPLVETPEGTVALTLGEIAGGTFLKVENGLGKAFDYKAELSPGGPIAVCTVLPLLAGYEQWPRRRVESMVLRDFVQRDTNEVVCPDPAPQSVSRP